MEAYFGNDGAATDFHLIAELHIPSILVAHFFAEVAVVTTPQFSNKAVDSLRLL